MITNRLRGRNIYVIRKPMLIRILTKQFVKYIHRDLALQFLLQGRLGLHSALPTGLQAPLGIHFGVPAVLQAPLRLHFGLQTGLLSACSKALRKLLAYALSCSWGLPGSLAICLQCVPQSAVKLYKTILTRNPRFFVSLRVEAFRNRLEQKLIFGGAML